MTTAADSETSLPQIVVLTVLVTVSMLAAAVIVDKVPSTVTGDAVIVLVAAVAVIIRVDWPLVTGDAVMTFVAVAVVIFIVEVETEVTVLVVMCG